MKTKARHNAPDPVMMPDCISPVAATVWLGWQPVAQVQFSGSSIDSITYLTGDQIGSPRLGTDDSQQVVWRWDSDAFGSVEPATDPDGDGAHVNVENRFAGQYADGESGLRYNWHRYYDAGKGRYVSSDPIGLEGGINTFGYVGGNPVNWFDPWGLARFPSVTPGGVSVTMNNDKPANPSPNQEVSQSLVDTMVKAFDETEGLESVNINSTTGGEHGANSAHPDGRACDVDTLNGKPADASNPMSEALQQALANQENIRENFGPTRNEKTVKTYEADTDTRGTRTVPKPTMADSHRMHVHGSVQR